MLITSNSGLAGRETCSSEHTGDRKCNYYRATVARAWVAPFCQVRKVMVDLGAYKDKFGDSGQRILEHAMTESRRRDQNYVSVEHIVEALMQGEPDMFNST